MFAWAKSVAEPESKDLSLASRAVAKRKGIVVKGRRVGPRLKELLFPCVCTRVEEPGPSTALGRTTIGKESLPPRFAQDDGTLFYIPVVFERANHA